METYLLCECCTFKIEHDDESACRDYYGHTHPAMSDIPARIVQCHDVEITFSTLPNARHCDGCGQYADDFATMYVYARIARD